MVPYDVHFSALSSGLQWYIKLVLWGGNILQDFYISPQMLTTKTQKHMEYKENITALSSIYCQYLKGSMVLLETRQLTWNFSFCLHSIQNQENKVGYYASPFYFFRLLFWALEWSDNTMTVVGIFKTSFLRYLGVKRCGNGDDIQNNNNIFMCMALLKASWSEIFHFSHSTEKYGLKVSHFSLIIEVSYRMAGNGCPLIT